MQKFGGGGSIDDEKAAQYHDRFVSDAPQDQDFDSQAYHQGATEYLGQLPDDQFQHAASQSYAQMQPQQRQGLVSSLMSAIEGHGGNLGEIGNSLGLSSTDPRQMSPNDYASLANYTRKNQPDAMQQVIQEKPWYLKMLGHPVLMGVMGWVASKMINRHMAGR